MLKETNGTWVHDLIQVNGFNRRCKSRLEYLEKLSDGLYRTLTLPDGQQIRCTHEEMMAAVIAAMHHQEHPLLPYVRQMDTKEGMPGLIRALEESHAREQL